MEFELLDSTLLVTLVGEIDHHTCAKMRQAIDTAYQKQRAKNILFNFENVTFMDSSGIGMLIGRYKQVNLDGGKIALYHVPKEIGRVLKMSNIGKLMKEYPDKQIALKSLA